MSLTPNGFFKQLPSEVHSLVLAACEPVILQAGQALGRHDTQPTVYFLADATVALVVAESGQKSLAVGLLGAGDAAGLEHVVQALNTSMSPSTTALILLVQTSGAAWAISALALRAQTLQHPILLIVIARHLGQLVSHVAAVAAGIQRLDIRARLAAWLVLSAQQARTNVLHLTHEHLAHMLGVRRVSITLAAGELRDQGLLSYSRGQVRILDMSGLMRASQPA